MPGWQLYVFSALKTVITRTSGQRPLAIISIVKTNGLTDGRTEKVPLVEVRGCIWWATGLFSITFMLFKTFLALKILYFCILDKDTDGHTRLYWYEDASEYFHTPKSTERGAREEAKSARNNFVAPQEGPSVRGSVRLSHRLSRYRDNVQWISARRSPENRAIIQWFYYPRGRIVGRIGLVTQHLLRKYLFMTRLYD